MKQKILKQGVLYISKKFKNSNISTEENRFFPFLNSHLFDAEAKKKLSFDRIQGICDSKNIFNFVNQRPQCFSFLFFGRSNVGKSSLINKLIGVPVNETSKRPGKTKELVFLRLNTIQRSYFVDAPGYGYASAASKDEIRKWGKLVEVYLKNTPTGDNEQIMLLLDVNHGIKNVDIMLMDMLKEFKRQFIIVYTKCDRASQAILKESQQTVYKLQQKYDKMNFYVHYTSSETLLGIQGLRNHILFKIIANKLPEE